MKVAIIGATGKAGDLIAKEAVKHGTRREAEILRIRYYRGKTQTEAAAETGVSQAQISRIEKAALEKLKKYMT